MPDVKDIKKMLHGFKTSIPLKTGLNRSGITSRQPIPCIYLV